MNHLLVPHQLQGGTYLAFGGGTGITSDGFHLRLMWFKKALADVVAKVLCLYEPQMTFARVGGQPSSVEFRQHLPEMA